MSSPPKCDRIHYAPATTWAFTVAVVNAVIQRRARQCVSALTKVMAGIVRLVNTVGVDIAMELELMGEPIDAQRAKEVHLVNRVVPHHDLMATAEDIAAKILRNPRAAVESAKQTILEVVGRPLDDQLRLECLYGYSTMGNPEIVERQQEFIERRDADRVTTRSSATD